MTKEGPKRESAKPVGNLADQLDSQLMSQPAGVKEARSGRSRKDPTRIVMWIMVCAVLFVSSTLLYQALSGRQAYIDEYAAQSRAWEASHADVLPVPSDNRL